ncbi:MAG: hypothetical protein OXH75_01730 [Acidobacteria bacterium]|nr:hypothetical protein [Acidobacteriota bacterium]
MPGLSGDSGSRTALFEWRGYAQLLLILLAVAIAVYFARAPGRVERGSASGPAREGAPPTARVIHPSPTEQTLTVELTGTVNLEERVRVASEVVGRVAWVSPDFSNGGSVRANETFVRIDPAEFELQVEAAAMAVRQADARVWVEKVRADEDVRAFERANPGVEASEGVRRLPSIAEAEAGLRKAQAELKLAELRLERTAIALPYDGRVLISDVDVGELVGPADLVGGPASRLGIVYRTPALQVDAPIEPRDLGYLHPVIGRAARVVGQTGTWEAEAVRVSSVVSPTTRLASVFLKFDEDADPDSLPAPGSFVEVDIEGPAYQDVYVLPESVLQERDRVWVVKDGRLSAFAPMTLGRTAAGLVVQAFDAGDGIVVGPLRGAREGLEVTAADAPPSSNRGEQEP